MKGLPPPGDVTRLLRRAAEGDEDVGEELYGLLYDHLRALAGAQMDRAACAFTWQPTALVHEAWLRLRGEEANFQDREHFLAVAARAMRFALVDQARRREAEKRGGGKARVELDGILERFEDSALDLLALHEAVERLAACSARQARVVELRFFGGMTTEGAARALGISVATAERDWYMARGFLRHHLAG